MRAIVPLLTVACLVSSPALGFSDQFWAQRSAFEAQMGAKYEKLCSEAKYADARKMCFAGWQAFLDEAKKQDAEYLAREQREIDDNGRQQLMQKLDKAADAANQTYYCSYVGNGQTICNPN